MIKISKKDIKDDRNDSDLYVSFNNINKKKCKIPIFIQDLCNLVVPIVIVIGFVSLVIFICTII
jgi:hypothetical protein